jgi:sigma-B regulation protein RsbU (phosphoserine phosphatase)
MNENDALYGEERLQRFLNSIDSSCDLPELLERVKNDLNKHVGAAAQSDDITMLAVRFNG